jgi:AcrR family transcriptional regulator
MPSVTRKSSRDKTARRDELLVGLLDALDKELSSGRAYMDVSVAELSKAGGLARSTFYAYFGDKSDLVRLWFERTRSEIHDASEAWWALGPDVRRADLRAALAQLVHTYQPIAHMMAAVYDAAAYDAAVRDEVALLMDENITALRRHIQAGQRGGWVDPDLAPLETASWLMWMSERTMHQVVLRPDQDAAETELHIDAFTRIVWRTLYASAARG